MTTAKAPPSRQEHLALRALQTYRALLAISLLAMVFTNVAGFISEARHPYFLILTVVGYSLTLVVLNLLFDQRKSEPSTQAQVLFLLDIITLPLLIQFGGALTNGFGMLLAVSIAITSLLVRGQLILFFAAMATISLFIQQIYVSRHGGFDAKEFTLIGLAGAAYFAIALLASHLGGRVRESETLVERQALDLADLTRINQKIIQQMSAGVVVCDLQGRIRLLNRAASEMMGLSRGAPALLVDAHADLDRLRKQWLVFGHLGEDELLETPERRLLVRFQHNGEAHGALLIFLDDASEALQQARQIKLASLGRLTGGIAHQIRNPLSSISHAAQLIAESDQLSEADLRLTEIIRNNSQRVNEIIESILQLSRRPEGQKQRINLKEFLQNFIVTFTREHPSTESKLCLHFTDEIADLWAQVDSTQLDQVLTNLCENALRHSGQGENTRIDLFLDHQTNGSPQIRLWDNGTGLNQETQERLFEPFFTTRADGTGLGLYIARELCEANDIRIRPMPSDEGTCFQLAFAANNNEAHDN